MVAQRAELAGDDERVGVGVGLAEVVGPVDRGASRSTPELGDRQLPRLLTETHLVDEPRRHRRHHEAGAGDIDDQVDLLRLQFGLIERLAYHRGYALLGLRLVDGAAGIEPRMSQDLVDRLYQMSFLHPRVLDQAEGQVDLRMVAVQPPGQLEGFLIGDDVLGDRDRWFTQNRHRLPPSGEWPHHADLARAERQTCRMATAAPSPHVIPCVTTTSGIH